MTTPQSMLFQIHNKINELRRMFDPDEDSDEDLFDRVRNIEEELHEMNERIKNLVSTQNLLIKLLDKLSKDCCDK